MLRFCFTLCFVLFVLSPTIHARIGESRSTVEGRLLSSGGIIYRDEATKNARMKGKPYPHLLQYVKGAEVRIYFKTDDGRAPSSSELNAKRMPAGWDFHVVYLNGKSVLELFERSWGMNGFESNQLLSSQAGGSYWKRLGKGEEKAPSALGYEMERADGAVRARKISGKILMFVDPEFDMMLAEA